MGRNSYNTYRGRKSTGRRVLVGVVVALVILLILAAVGVGFLRNYIVYTDNGMQLVLPFTRSSSTPAPPADNGPALAEPDDGFVIEPVETVEPSDAPAASPAPPAEADYEPLPRRTAPLGLALASHEGTEGGIFDMTLPGQETAEEWEALRARNQSLRYAAAYLGAGADLSPERLLALAWSGFDELVVDLTGAEDRDPEETAGSCRDIRKTLDEMGYLGYFSVVCRRSVFTDEGQMAAVLPAVAESCDRVYASNADGWGGLNIYNQLRDLQFRGTTRDIVTVVNKPVSTNWAWAILPSQ